jgi:hypothetical protein
VLGQSKYYLLYQFSEFIQAKGVLLYYTVYYFQLFLLVYRQHRGAASVVMNDRSRYTELMVASAFPEFAFEHIGCEDTRDLLIDS